MGGDEQEWLDAREKFFSVLDKHDKPYSGFERMSMVIMSADVMHLMAMGQDLAQAREIVASPETNGETNGEKKENGVRVEKN